MFCDKIGLLQSSSGSQWRVRVLMFVQISSKQWKILFPNLYCDASSWVEVCKKIDVLFSRSRSLQELIWSKYDNFYCIFWIANPFATKLGCMVHYHKPECFYGEIGLFYSRSRQQQNFNMSMNVCPDTFWSLTLLLPNLVWWCIIPYEPDCLSERLVCCLQGQGYS